MRLTESCLKGIREQTRFKGLEKFDGDIKLSAPFLHGDEQEYINKILTSGNGEAQIELAERAIGDYLGVKHVAGVGSVSAAVISLILYEGGEPVFIDASDMDWGMDPEVLEMVFEKYPDVRIVIMSHAYGFPGQVLEIKNICDGHGRADGNL